MTTDSPAGRDLLRARIAEDIVGPVVHRWLAGLHQYVSHFDDGATAFLYVARAGVRIRALYARFLNGFAPGTEPGGEMFWTSRLAVCKGTATRIPRRAAAQIAREYGDAPLADLVAGLLRHQPALAARLRDKAGLGRLRARDFPDWLEGGSADARLLRDYLRGCGAAMDGYVAQLTAGKRRAVLIDSGWQGSAQSLLAEAWPDIAWKGLYAGRILGPHHDRLIVPDMIGILFESPAYDPAVPASALVHHHHLFETLLEPNGPSVEEIAFGPSLAAARPAIEANLADTPDPERDWLYLAVCGYLDRHAGLGLAGILSRFDRAAPELARLVLTPTRDEAQAFYCKPRSADFGKDLDVPVLLSPDDARYPSADDRQRHALWRQGQIALDLPAGLAADAQLKASGLTDMAAYFDPAHAPDARRGEPAVAAAGDRPAVAIVTRTKNRPLLLARAGESVAAQTFRDYLWVVVNDGGDRAIVEEVMRASPVDPRRMLLVSNARSLGMEAASNAGIRACDSDFVVIHDDDDSWEPAFLERTAGFLSSGAGARYGGAISRSTYVSEEVRDGRVIVHERRPYQDWVRNVQLAEMFCGNFFPPIAFLFRRSVWDRVGGYNEDFPVLGDWFFNLEFLLEADIALVAEPLANYHHRDKATGGQAGTYANSVIGGQSKHEEFAAVLRNAFLRRHGDRAAGLGAILGYIANDTRFRIGEHGRGAGGPFVAGQGAPGGRSGPVTQDEVLDAADRAFAVAHVNRQLARWWGPVLRLVGVRALPADADWGAIRAACRWLRTAPPPPPYFSEEDYIAVNDDVREALSKGKLRGAFEHYVRFGQPEGRPRQYR